MFVNSRVLPKTRSESETWKCSTTGHVTYRFIQQPATGKTDQCRKIHAKDHL